MFEVLNWQMQSFPDTGERRSSSTGGEVKVKVLDSILEPTEEQKERSRVISA